MSAIGGDIIEITYNHPTLGSGVFYPKSGEDSTLDLGGIRSNDDVNMVDGAGRMIKQMNRTRWSLDTVIAMDMNTEDTLKRATDLSESPDDAEYTISHINGSVYSGSGTPVGDIAGSLNGGTFKLKLSGGLKLKKII